MVTETERVRSSALSCISMRVSVVLPAPEGEDRIRIIPRRLGFAILRSHSTFCDLLAELLDLRPEFKPLRGQRDVVRLGAEGVGLAAELLGEEIEPPADRPALVDEGAGGGDMRLQPVELLADVRPGGDEDRLLVQPVLVEAARDLHQRRDAFGEPRLDRLGPPRRIRVGGERQPFDRVEPLAQEESQRLALASSGLAERRERLVEA